ncbi:MAG: aminotransferase class IV [Salinivirgaceae bacterium]|nr:aminotransferase class IV [Salinivirgaceae bacterium]
MDSRYNLISFNKQYMPVDSFNIGLQNRAFRYGDGFFETMHANGLHVQFVDDHYQRILKSANILKLTLPDYFSQKFLEEQIAGLLSRCKLFQAVRVKLTVFRSGEGFYVPNSNVAAFLIDATYLGKGPYELNAEGINMGIYKEIPKPKLPYSSIKSMNAQLYVLAGIYANSNKFDDVLLVNDGEKIVEATSSNVFAVKGKTVFTPAVSSGCVEGIMRKQIIHIAESMGYCIVENEGIDEHNLLDMDELFLTNAIVGIKHISGFEKRRYYRKNAIKFMKELNRIAFNSKQD